MKPNVESWIEFKLTDVFIVKGGFYNKKPEHEIEGSIPFLASTEANNGVTEYYSIDDIRKWGKTGSVDNTLSQKIYKGNCIAVTVNGSVCNAFYQAEDFTCSHDITALYPIGHTFSKAQALFICTVIMKEKYRWSYGRKPHDVKKFGRSIIKLPVTANNDIDWDFMEQYIKSLNHKPLTTQNRSSQHPLNIDSWQEFKVGDYFDVYLSSGDPKIDACEPGKIPLVSSGATNNGIVGYIDDKGDGKAQIFKANSITVDMFCNAFYQNNDYYAVSHGRVNILYPKFKCNPLIGCFICSVINNERFKYSYGRAVYSDEISRMVIKLPTTSGNVPDFNFMENYMKSLPYGDRI